MKNDWLLSAGVLAFGAAGSAQAQIAAPVLQNAYLSAPSVTPTLSAIGLSGTTFNSGAASGTAIGTINVTGTGSLSPTLSLSDTTHFQLSGTGNGAVLETTGATACTSYTETITATQTGAVNSPLSQAETITCNPITLAFTALANGTAGGSPVSGSGTYGVAAPSSLTGTYTDGCTGTSTASSYTASGGTWTALWTPPASACSGEIIATGSGGNTLSATSPVATFSAGSTDDRTKPGPSTYLYNNPYYDTAQSAGGTKYFVATTGSDSNNCLSAGAPCLTIQHAVNLAIAGGVSSAADDLISVAAGTYTAGAIFKGGGNAATSTGYLAVRCATLDGCIVTDPGSAGGSNGAFAFVTGISGVSTVIGAYVIIDGFSLQSSNNGQTYGQGIEIFDALHSGQNFATHHVWFINNIVTNYSQSGIQMNSGDFLYAVHNSVYLNANNTCSPYGSGISFAVLHPDLGYTETQDDKTPPMLNGYNLGPTATPSPPSTTYYAAAIAYNLVRNNYNCSGATDGNGIILDTNDGESAGPFANTPYANSVLVLGNVVANSGGRGIESTASRYYTFINNSSYNNGLGPLQAGTEFRTGIGSGSQETVYSGTNPSKYFINNISYAIPASGDLAYNTAYVGNDAYDTFQTNELYCASTPAAHCASVYNSSVFSCTGTLANVCGSGGANGNGVAPNWTAVGTSTTGSNNVAPSPFNFALTTSASELTAGQAVSVNGSVTYLGACPSSSVFATCP